MRHPQFGRPMLRRDAAAGRDGGRRGWRAGESDEAAHEVQAQAAEAQIGGDDVVWAAPLLTLAPSKGKPVLGFAPQAATHLETSAPR